MEFRRVLGVDLAQALKPWPVFALLLAVTLAARAQTFGNPVTGFDEQFYLLVGDRMLSGSIPYVDIFDRKPIGLFLIHAAVRLLGGEGTIQTQLVACAIVTATAFAIYRLACRIAPTSGAVAAALAYIFWLNLTEGEGYQAEVWFNLPMALAALLVCGAPRNVLAYRGLVAMLLVGLALQIKYSVVFEGLFLGLALLWQARHRTLVRLVGLAALWASAALLPTFLAAAAYWQIGYFDAWLFANFTAIAGKLPDPLSVKLEGFGLMALIAAPLVIAAIARPASALHRFVLAWLAASIAGVLLFGSYGAHYLMPVLVPLTIAAAPRLARPAWAVATLALGLIAGQAALALTYVGKGGRTEALAVAQAARPSGPGCLWVYDGYPALYRLTESCLPTRYVFPGHLNTANEASAAALGIDPQAEVRRILASRPETIVDNYPRYSRGNRATAALVDAALASDYLLVATIRTGATRERRVYRARDAGR
ncbi:MAG: hypothetical protein ACKVOP_00445 [Sphingomonadaceae bacterium]